MEEDQWISVADAADFIGEHAPRIISWAWKLGTVRLYGMRPGEPEPVEIPAHEGGSLDCDESWVVIGDLCTTYRGVTLRLADLEWLAQAQDKLERQALQASEGASSAPQAAADSRNPSAAEIGRLGGRKSGELRRANRKWVPHATILAGAACSRNLAASNADIADAIEGDWKGEADCPAYATLLRFVSKLRKNGELPPRAKPRARSASRAARSPSGV
jgi:hypothetical protein